MINYYLLMKPGIILGNLVTLAAGFLLASKGTIDFALFSYTLLGLGFIMGSGCVFNNLIDLERDRKMKRTQSRPLVLGLISPFQAKIYGGILLMMGNLILIKFTNGLTVALADFGFFVYVILYSLWKGRTVFGTAIGSIAGAIPPVVGYCAVKNQIDLGAVLLFLLLVMWQMPHFFSIAILHLDDYTAAKIPALPLVKGLHRAKIHMVLYILAFNLIVLAMTYLGYTGLLYLIVTFALGLGWLILSLTGFKTQDSLAWSRKMFQWSLVLIVSTSFVLLFD